MWCFPKDIYTAERTLECWHPFASVLEPAIPWPVAFPNWSRDWALFILEEICLLRFPNDCCLFWHQLQRTNCIILWQLLSRLHWNASLKVFANPVAGQMSCPIFFICYDDVRVFCLVASSGQQYGKHKSGMLKLELIYLALCSESSLRASALSLKLGG